MEKRLNERIHVVQKIIIVHGDVISTAVLNDCSEKGMYVESGTFFPLDSIFKIIIPGNDQILTVPVRVVRLAATGAHKGMGVELLNVSPQYLEFIIKYSLGCSF
jgi:hypothetical protein